MPTDASAPSPAAPSPAEPVREALGDLLLGIDHVGIAVPDLDVALALYTDVFGFRLQAREINEGQGVQEALLAGPSTAGPSSAGPTAAGFGARIQLLAPLDESSTIARFLDRSGPGLQQLALRVSDVEAAAAALRAAGLRLLYDEARPGSEHSMINFVHPKDAAGVLVELVQPAASTAS